MRKALAGALLLLVTSGAQANFLDGYELRARCESRRIDFINTCLGYLTGIADSDDAAPSWRLAQKMFCIPRGVTASELRSALIHHVSEHPEEEDLNAAILVGNAFIETYPCD
jgi:hypothetical protein